MKKLAALILAGLCIGYVNAQKKESASVDQTVEYLNQKAKEIVGYNKVFVSQKIFLNRQTITDGHFKKTTAGVELYVHYKAPGFAFYTYTSFNPKHIVSITNTSKDNVSGDSPIGTLEIKFIGQTALFNNNGEPEVVTDKTFFNFLQADPGNESRITNALNRLKTLYKQEDKLFDK